MVCNNCIAPSQHSISPSPGLMQSTSEPHFSHWNRLPSWFAMLLPPLLLLFHLLAATLQLPFAAFGHDHLSVALAAQITLAYLVCQ